jgi:anti-anti-sigma factor
VYLYPPVSEVRKDGEHEAGPIVDGITRIRLEGRLDIAGAQDVDLRFAGICSTVARGVVVDLSGVTFLASMGIRILISNAKTLERRGAAMVLFAPSPLVTEVLTSVGIHQLIPVLDTLDAALDTVKGTGRTRI